jgi:hypothetical protein
MRKNSATNLNDKLLTEAEASEMLDVPAVTLRIWRFRKKGPAYLKIGDRIIRYRQSVLTQYLKDCEVVHGPMMRAAGDH